MAHPEGYQIWIQWQACWLDLVEVCHWLVLSSITAPALPDEL